MKSRRLLCFLIVPVLLLITPAGFAQTQQPVRIVMIGAHPDDCDIKGGGTAALFAAMGYAVKFVAVTNGDAGHQTMGGGPLAKRRFEEAQESARRLGIAAYHILPNHDGELLPSLSVRLEIIREIREWNADVVISPRPNDYHPDHRYTGVLVQDAAFMVGVPNVASDVPALRKNPVFLYFEDYFQRPNPFRPDVSVDISSVFDKKVNALDAHKSQVYEWLPWIGNYATEVPAEGPGRIKWLATRYTRKITPEARKTLETGYGKEKAQAAQHAESFEICEYGTQPTPEEIRRLFPMVKMP